MSIRNGRFFFDNQKNAGNYNIVENSSSRGKAVYRLFNSGEMDLAINVGNGQHMLGPDRSIDVAIGKSAALNVSWAQSAKEKDIRLSYNFLTSSNGESLEDVNQIRSGRFSGTVKAAPADNVVVDLGSASSAFYRVFNTSEKEDLELLVGGKTNAISVPAKFSKDILVMNHGSNKGLLAVAPDTTVDFIYDLLGGFE